MRATSIVMLALCLAACAGGDRGDTSDAERRRAERELEEERLCRIYAEQGREDPRCDRYPQEPRRSEPAPRLPPLPDPPPLPPPTL